MAEHRQINLGASVGVEVFDSGTAKVELLDPVSNMICARWRAMAAVVFLLEQFHGVAPSCCPGCTVLSCITSTLAM